MDTVICVPARPGDLIDLDFLAQTTYYHPDMQNYLVVYDPTIFTAVQGGVIDPNPVSGPEAFLDFKRSGKNYETTHGADGVYTLLVGNHPNTQYYVMFEGHDGDVSLIRERGKDLIVKVGLYVAIQEARVSGGPTNQPPSVVFKSKKAFTIDNQSTGVDETGNPIYVIDASVTTTLQEVEQLRLDQLGQQITFNDKDGILRIEVGILQSPNKSVVMPLLGYSNSYFRFSTPTEERCWSEDRTIRIPFIDKEVKLYTAHKSEVIKQGQLIPNKFYIFSSNKWPDVTMDVDIDENLLPKLKLSQLAPVRITAYDGAGAKTIVNLIFKDKMTGK